ncbi:MAG: class I SAM-dependent methyltransferase [Acidobacteria bacterium]|nr:class I SAM-dependent methyltransferase [Acidobacteriota bacterium]
MAISGLKRWLWRRTAVRKDTAPPALADVASEDLYFVPPNVNLDYTPTFGFEGFLNKEHEEWANWPLTPDRIVDHRIFGWLRRADALKLYEMAAMCDGDILELGTHQGLSSHIMTAALRRFGDTGKRRICTIDLDEPCVNKACENLAGEIAEGLVDVRVGEAGEVCRRYIAQGKRFGFIFVDHSHYYGPMREVCQMLGQLVAPGGFVLFHDFTDPRSAFPESGKPEPDFGVLAACVDSLPDGEFEYYGAFGCAGLYGRRA